MNKPTPSSLLKSISRWMLVFLSFLGAIIALMSYRYLAIILFILAGSLLIPKISKLIIQKIPILITNSLRYATIVILFLIGLTQIGNMKGKSNTNPEAIKHKTIDGIYDDFWDLYAPEVKKRAIKLVEAKDCKGLQREFDIADQNFQNMTKGTKQSHRNTEYMQFLDNQMEECGCYEKK